MSIHHTANMDRQLKKFRFSRGGGINILSQEVHVEIALKNHPKLLKVTTLAG